MEVLVRLPDSETDPEVAPAKPEETEQYFFLICSTELPSEGFIHNPKPLLLYLQQDMKRCCLQDQVTPALNDTRLLCIML